MDDITDKEIMTGAVVFILLSSIDPKYEGGKRGRKAILKDVKKVLMTHSKGNINVIGNKDRYLKLVAAADDCQHTAKDFMVAKIGDQGNYINPGSLLQILNKRYPEYIKSYELKQSHIDNIYDHYSSAGIGFASIQFGNKLISEINEFLNITLEDKIVDYNEVA